MFEYIEMRSNVCVKTQPDGRRGYGKLEVRAGASLRTL